MEKWNVYRNNNKSVTVSIIRHIHNVTYMANGWQSKQYTTEKKHLYHLCGLIIDSCTEKVAQLF